MADELKSFPPSDLKLERLRQSGVVPYSKDVMTFAVVLGLFVGLWVLFGALERGSLAASQAAVFFQYQAEAGSAAAQKAAVEELIQAAASLCLAGIYCLLLPLIFIVLILGGLQTRFLFAPSAIRLDFSRLFAFERLSVGRLAANVMPALSRFLKLGCWIIVSIVILRYVFSVSVPLMDLQAVQIFGRDALVLPDAAVELPRQQRGVVQQLLDNALVKNRKQFTYCWFAALAFCLMLGILSRFLVVLRFRRDQRMSRAEVDAEYREMEQAPEFRRAQREQRAEE